jgi:hypothetical protein
MEKTMTDTITYEFKITETRVFDVAESIDDTIVGDDWQHHAEVMTAASSDGWELVSTELSYVSGKSITRGSAKTGKVIETHHPERRALAVWRRPAPA